MFQPGDLIFLTDDLAGSRLRFVTEVFQDVGDDSEKRLYACRAVEGWLSCRFRESDLRPATVREVNSYRPKYEGWPVGQPFVCVFRII
jgi:hypothetical protein